MSARTPGSVRDVHDDRAVLGHHPLLRAVPGPVAPWERAEAPGR